jgi:hypothetical protein
VASDLVVVSDFVYPRAFPALSQMEGINQRGELFTLAWSGFLKTTGEVVLGFSGLIGLEDMIAVFTCDRSPNFLGVVLGENFRSWGAVFLLLVFLVLNFIY